MRKHDQSHVANLLLRTEARVAIGTGHVMRCLALAQAWEDAGGRAIFAMAQATPAIEERLRSEAFEVARVGAQVGTVADAEETAELAHRRSASWVVVDGYEFGAEYQVSLKNRGMKVLFIDDNGHAGHYSADLVLNQNAYAREELYPNRELTTKLMLGPRFALLRRDFTAWRGWKREIPLVARKVLVTMGGSDPDNVTQRVVETILSERDFDMTIVIGGSNPHLAKLREFAGDCSPVRLVENAANMPELIANADLAVAGAGTTSWEMCFLGLPALLIVLADNQQRIADELGKRGIALNLGGASDIAPSMIGAQLRSIADSPAIRQEMSERGRALVDGVGAERVVCALKTDSLSIRPAQDEDCKLLWEWANDPVVRASAFSSQMIRWDEHVEWFRGKLNNWNCRILVCLDASAVPVGQIRFEKHGVSDADLDITVDGRLRGLGFGGRLISLGANWAFEEWGLTRLNAFVKPENVASAKAFERAGFESMETVIVKGQTAIHYVRTAK
ncbi:MAG: UDP-2,4-diacetamido-2,4,6-trideoxy-beta-L-altropyranose hydrolase [Candidatus Sulfotelmatobacter sp.]